VTERSKKFRRDKKSKIDSIIRATVALIEEKGYLGFSVNEIPELTNLSIGTVYRYFPNGKSDILREIITRNTQALMEMIFLEGSEEETFYDFWRRVISSYIHGHREGLFSLTAMEYSIGADQQFKEVLAPMVAENFMKLVKQIRRFEEFPKLSERTLFERVTLVFGFLGMFAKSPTTPSLFKSAEKLVDYLMDVSRLTFEMES
jgi:AcrR family transcriptional regulator